MKKLGATLMVAVMVSTGTAPSADAAPYVACRDGHIAPTLQACPVAKGPLIGIRPGGGGGGNGGGLFGTIGRVVHGLTGGLL